MQEKQVVQKLHETRMSAHTSASAQPVAGAKNERSVLSP